MKSTYLPSSVYNLCFYGIRRRFKAIPVGFRFSVFLSLEELHINSYKYNAVTQCHVDGSLRSLGYQCFLLAVFKKYADDITQLIWLLIHVIQQWTLARERSCPQIIISHLI